jgi:hypothetical protein
MAVYLLLVSAVALLLGFPDFAAGTLAGGAVSLVNLFWLRRHLVGILQLTGVKAGILSQLKYLNRLAITGILLYLLIVKAGINIAGLVTGLSALFAAVIAYLVTIITPRGKNQ